MPRVFKTRVFSRKARKMGLTDAALGRAAEEMRRGLIDADLGGGIFKKRVPLPGRGKSGGARTLLATNRADRWIFIYGFAKNEKADVSPRELAALQQLGGDLLGRSAKEILLAVEAGELLEIPHEEEDEGAEG